MTLIIYPLEAHKGIKLSVEEKLNNQHTVQTLNKNVIYSIYVDQQQNCLIE